MPASASSYRRSPALSRAFVRRKHCVAGDVPYSTTYYNKTIPPPIRCTRAIRCRVCFISLSISPICKPNFARISWRRRKTRQREYHAYVCVHMSKCANAPMYSSSPSLSLVGIPCCYERFASLKIRKRQHACARNWFLINTQRTRQIGFTSSLHLGFRRSNL